MSVSESEVATSLFCLKLFLGLKYFGLVYLIFLIVAVYYALSHLTSPYQLSQSPLFEELMRLYAWGLPYTVPSYSDIMAFVLLSKVGTDYDPASPFLKVTFFVVPILTLIPRLALFIKNAVRIQRYNIVSFLWALFYTVTPLAITTHLYYPLISI